MRRMHCLRPKANPSVRHHHRYFRLSTMHEPGTDALQPRNGQLFAGPVQLCASDSTPWWSVANASNTPGFVLVHCVPGRTSTNLNQKSPEGDEKNDRNGMPSMRKSVVGTKFCGNNSNALPQVWLSNQSEMTFQRKTSDPYIVYRLCPHLRPVNYQLPFMSFRESL